MAKKSKKTRKSSGISKKSFQVYKDKSLERRALEVLKEAFDIGFGAFYKESDVIISIIPFEDAYTGYIDSLERKQVRHLADVQEVFSFMLEFAPIHAWQFKVRF